MKRESKDERGYAPVDQRDWAEDPRLSAYALGELEGAERALVARFVADHAEARAWVDELAATARALESALAQESSAFAPALTDEQRDAVAASARRRHALGARRGWLGGAALVAAAALAGTISVLITQQARDSAPGYAYDISGGVPGGAGSVRGSAPAPATRFDRAGSSEPRRALSLFKAAPGAEGLETLSRQQDLPQADADMEVAEEREMQREGYDHIVENAFMPVKLDARSTFSIDVDTASYTNVRRMLNSGASVPPDAVRVEEFINYFPYSYDAPSPGAERPFAVQVAVAATPWAPQHRLVRIGLAAEALDLGERPAANLVFLLDVSGSMNDPRKLPLVKRALGLLVEQLGEGDRVSIVVYAGAVGLALPPTSGAAREAILQAIERLEAGGSTNGGAGIQLAYDVAREQLIEGGLNRVLLCTDGDFNVGVASDGELERLIAEEAKSGVFLTVLGFGAGDFQDAKMEKLSNRGNGNFAYIDSLLEARKVLVEQLGGTLATVAKDVKVQVEFNPAEVQAARLIGYENRVLAHQDFLDDGKDAGEIGAGHTVTALYEVIPVGAPYTPPPLPESRYTTEAPPARAAFSGELLTVRLRYKAPDGDVSTGFEVPVSDRGATFDAADEDTRFAAAVAAFGMVLRGSEHVGGATLDDVRRWALEALGEDRGGYRAGFLALVERARQR
ncbi:MAG: VWA domain-containing protein [Planctomycetota bacterium]